MKKDIHPSYKIVKISCACGAVYNTLSTKNYNIDICSQCHPFFTGKMKLIDTEGRVERFKKKYKYRVNL